MFESVLVILCSCLAATPVDDPIPLDLDSGTDKKIYDVEALHSKVSHSKYSVFIPTYNRTPEEKVSEHLFRYQINLFELLFYVS